MLRICQELLFVTLGLILIHTVTSQNATGTAPADASIQADVTNTVLALLNETGYAGNASDAKVQQIVQMLMNGQTPTDADLINLGIIPATQVATTPPTYNVPGAAAPTDPLQVNVAPSGTQPAQATPAPTTNTGGTGGSIVFPSFPSTGTGGTFPSFPTGGGSLPSLSGLFPNMFAPSTTTTKPPPSPVDILGSLSGAGTGGISNLNPPTSNAIGPKPQSPDPLFPPLFPNLGNPGGINPPPTGGILDTQHQQQVQRQQQNPMNNPMMMMMMMNPELMDAMLSGENPMMMYMFMQQMQGNKKQTPRPQTPPSMGMMDMMGGGGLGGLGPLSGGAGGLAGMGPLSGGSGGLAGLGPLPGGAGGLSGLSGGTGMDLMSAGGMGPLSGLSSGSGMSPAGSGTNFMDMMNMMSKPSVGGAPLPAPGGTGMDFTSMLNSLGGAGSMMPSPLGGGLSPTGVTGGLPGGDMMMTNLASLINSPPPTAGALPSPTPLDPFVNPMG